MKHHWGWTVLVLVLGYLVGASRFGSYGKGIVSKVGLGG